MRHNYTPGCMATQPSPVMGEGSGGGEILAPSDAEMRAHETGTIRVFRPDRP